MQDEAHRRLALASDRATVAYTAESSTRDGLKR